jgi:predicted nuclease of predicted toxin-antitoxin system
MKFLVDAHLPPGLCALRHAAGHDALHTTGLPAHNQTSDRVINELSATEQRVVISKDTDFYYSHVLHRRPWKLLLVRTGNIRTRELKELFQRQLPAIVQALENHSLVELDRTSVQVVT